MSNPKRRSPITPVGGPEDFPVTPAIRKATEALLRTTNPAGQKDPPPSSSNRSPAKKRGRQAKRIPGATGQPPDPSTFEPTPLEKELKRSRKRPRRHVSEAPQPRHDE